MISFFYAYDFWVWSFHSVSNLLELLWYQNFRFFIFWRINFISCIVCAWNYCALIQQYIMCIPLLMLLFDFFPRFSISKIASNCCFAVLLLNKLTTATSFLMDIVFVYTLSRFPLLKTLYPMSFPLVLWECSPPTHPLSSASPCWHSPTLRLQTFTRPWANPPIYARL